MNIKPILLLVLLGLSIATLRSEATLPAAEARQKLQAGALLVDVRTKEEFADRKLPGAINIPVDSIKSGITKPAPDKSTAVLLHCRSGRRSAIAEKELRALGYTNVWNIGSFEQAEKVVNAK